LSGFRSVPGRHVGNAILLLISGRQVKLSHANQLGNLFINVSCGMAFRSHSHSEVKSDKISPKVIHLFRSEVSGFKLVLFYSCVSQYTVGRFRSFTLRRYRNVVFSSFNDSNFSKWPKLTRRDVTVFTFPLPEALRLPLTVSLCRCFVLGSIGISILTT